MGASGGPRRGQVQGSVGRASSYQSRLPQPLPPPPAGEEDLVEGETLRGKEHQSREVTKLAFWPSLIIGGSEAHPALIWRGGVLKPIKLVVRDLRPFWGVAASQKLGLCGAPFENGLKGRAGTLTGDAAALIIKKAILQK